ncbi:hypothetical protein STVA_03970 [Allostella vacuolata]|nr:hypothetical protein STVA_03970 [Stella vacuolata]
MDTQSPGSPILALDSITHTDSRCIGAVVLAASHGGAYSGYLAAKARVRAAIFNDAGVGLDEAGIGGLAYLEQLGIPAAAALHTSCRIGDGGDLLARGRIGHANAPARRLGCLPGQTAAAAASHLAQATGTADGSPPPADENRFLVHERPGGPKIWALDSASLVQADDAGHVVITGSHGELMGGNPALAIKAAVLAAIFNDAGVGMDGAGTGRLPVLDARGIAAATVDHRTARIGDGRSAWETGRLSHVNRTAAALGARAGMPVAEFCERVLAACKKD